MSAAPDAPVQPGGDEPVRLPPAELVSLSPDVFTEPFWVAAAEHRLVVPRCTTCGTFRLPPSAPARPYLSIPLQTPHGYTPNDASAGDLDGDGEYEIVLHQVGRGRDNAQAGRTTEPIMTTSLQPSCRARRQNRPN